ncbi:membrane protein insertase YidC [Rhodovibrio salinarum]|uniref:Membrane protein insertase YidC n=1 Tax=Rhodovibrio salinarum TaxID=1087 RepID=A0A934QH06_9PROT|nr:membrane protein insertase YidC [Rhodovibrio salinarum]MBK1696724.1 membrane protein insertase YidC [Rhodovibrio salinarum]
MEQRNLILAIVASIAILLGFELLYNAPQREQQAQQAAQQETTQQEQSGGASQAPSPQGGDGGGGVPGAAPGQAGALDRGEVLDDTQRVEIDTPSLTGSINVKGARIDDLTLRNYHQEVDDDSPLIDLLSPEGATKAYYADFGWAPASRANVTLPDGQTNWQVDSGGPLTPDNPVTLSWSNGEGLTFKRTFSIDEDFMFTVEQTVVNETGEPVSLAPYGLVNRRGTPNTLGYYILHEGPIGVFNGTLDEVDYDDVQEDGPIAYETTGGWIGITDKYWLVSLVPNQDQPVNARFIHNQSNAGVAKYQADVLYDSQQVAPGESMTSTSRLFAGAKKVSVLDGYAEQYGIPHFDKAVDFGWFYFLTKPIFHALHFFAQMTGNFGVAIICLVVILKILLFPLANKSYRSMAKMRKLQPEMQNLRERFGEDKQRLNQEMMALYKREGANPASGCLPILLQIPVFFALYKVLFVTIEMRHAPFVGYLQDLSSKDPTSILNLFGILPWGVPELGALSILNIGFLPLIMGISMYGQQMLNPQPADPMQARIFQFLPVIFTFILSQFPAGLVLYWTSNNMLTIAQQYIIMKRAGMQIGGKQTASAGATDSSAKSGGSSGSGGSGGGKKRAGKQKGESQGGQQAAAANGGPTLEGEATDVTAQANGEGDSSADGQAQAGSESAAGAGQQGSTGGKSAGGQRSRSGQQRGSSNPAAKRKGGGASKSKKGGGRR